MIPIHPHLISQLIADRQAGLMAGARQQRLARQARAARAARPARHGPAAPRPAAPGRRAWRSSSPRARQAPAASPAQAAPAPRGLDLPNLAAPALTHPDIARQPVPGGHTAHRHLASIFRTLSRSSRAAAAGGRPPGARRRTPNGHAVTAGHRACRPPRGEPGAPPGAAP